MMKKRFLQGVCALMAGVLIAGSNGVAQAAATIDTAKTASYLQKTVTTPQIGSVGGEWTVLGLARSDSAVPQIYFAGYVNRVQASVKASKGVLTNTKYTEYSRVVLALTAVGADPTHVSGYNLLAPLGNYDQTIKQGVTGPIFALLALDSKNYGVPKVADARAQATRVRYVQRILQYACKDGGFAMKAGTNSDADITAMAVQALTKYQSQPEVKKAVAAALARLSQLQNADGGYSADGVPTAESTAQILIALCENHISPKDARFVKNGKSVVDALLRYRLTDGSFSHVQGGSHNLMATEQAFCALVAVSRAENGKSSFYDLRTSQKTAAECAIIRFSVLLPFLLPH